MFTQLNGNLGKNLDFGSYKIARIEFTSEQDSLYFRLPTKAWSKAYAFIIGADNINGYINETVFAHTSDKNTITCMYNSQSKIAKTWVKDETNNWNVHCDGGFKPYGNVIVIYSGFDKLGAYTYKAS